MQNCFICFKLFNFKCCIVCKRYVCNRCLFSIRVGGDTEILDAVCCNQVLYDIRLVKFYTKLLFNRNERFLINRFIKSKTICQNIFREIYKDKSHYLNYDFELFLTFSKDCIYEVNNLGILCKDCNHRVIQTYPFSYMFVTEDCRCNKSKVYLDSPVDDYKWILIYKEENECMYELISMLRKKYSSCRICNKRYRECKMLVCCKNYQCTECGYILDEDRNVKDFQDHVCKAFKYCPECKLSIVKTDDSCNEITCVCGAVFDYENLVQIDKVSYISMLNLYNNSIKSFLNHKKVLERLSLKERLIYILTKFSI